MATKSKGIDSSTSATDRKFTGLRRFNLIMGFLHLVQGIFMILVSNETTYPIFTNYLNFDLATRSLKPGTELFYELPFGTAVAFFLLISAVAHFYLATIGYERYVQNLKKGMNPVRFYEYALSSSLMIVLIGMLIGIWDLGAIILLFTLNATMNLFGIMMELHNQHTQKTDWTAFIYGCIAGIRPMGGDHAVLRRRGKFRGMPSRLPLCTPSSHTVCLLQHFRHQHGFTIQEDRSLERLPVRGTRLHHPEPIGQIRAVLADLDRHPGPCIKTPVLFAK
jgi:hypothetical protein